MVTCPSDPLYKRLISLSRCLTRLIELAESSHPIGAAHATFSLARAVVRLDSAHHDAERYRRALADFASRYPSDEVIRFGRWTLREQWHLLPPEPGAPQLYLQRRFSDDRDDLGLHDHPSYSASLLLTGHLVEHWREDGAATVESRDVIDPFQVLVRSPRIAHRLAIGDGHPITLVATGPPIREWGFWQRDADRFPVWRHWRDAA